MKKGFVSIILLNYNGKQFNKNCIDSILNQSYQEFEIVFVDNCSTDGSLEEVQHTYKNEIKKGKIKIVKNSKNMGFAGGNNVGVENVTNSSEYVCLLNNDTVVKETWLEVLVNGIESDKSLGAVSCVILDKGCEKKTQKSIFIDHKKIVSSVFGEFILNDISAEELEKNFYYTTFLSGCCFLYRAKIVKQPFESYYFIYAEDVYLSLYLLKLGYRMGVCLDTCINHYGSPVFGRAPSLFKLFHGNKNQIINYLVFYPLLYRVLLFPLFLIKELAHLFMGAPLMRFKAKINSLGWICHNYSKIRATRENIKKNKRISDYDFINQLSFKLSDKYFMESKVSSLLVTMGNIFFILYGLLIKAVAFLMDCVERKLFNRKNNK